MNWLQSLDTTLFQAVNTGLANPVFDVLMPFVSGNAFFAPAVILLAVALIWKTGRRGLLFVILMSLIVGVGDGVICKNLKGAIGRPRPFLVLEDVRKPGSKKASVRAPSAGEISEATGTVPAAPAPSKNPMKGSASMPSSHAANWFCATMIAYVYFRRSIAVMLPMAVLVSFSRVYNGVHYPSDVIAGAILGAGYAVALLWGVNAFWQLVGRRWFPLWWERLPSLVYLQAAPSSEEMEEEPEFAPRDGAVAGMAPRHVSIDQHWLLLGYLLIAGLLFTRLAYLASGTIQLCEDEAYQWLWSKNLDWSYYSKPPLIAYVQFLGTALWGDTEFGIRFLSPVLTAIMSIWVLRFFAREFNARAGVFLVLILSTTVLTAVGAVLLTVDPLSVFFWTAAMLSGWRAVQERGTTRDWLWVGLWMGLGFLSKYTALFQLLCWAVFFLLWAPARKHLRRPGPWLALGLNLALAAPVLIWNWQHDWITVTHVQENAGVGKAWRLFVLEFLGSELALLNPVYFIATLWAAILFWRSGRQNPRLLYLLAMGAPVFLVYFAYSFRSRILPNWIAPGIVPLFCFMVAFWDTRLRLAVNARKIKGWLLTGLLLGTVTVVFGHQTDLYKKITGKWLPLKLDVLHRVREWDKVAASIGQAREELLAEGKPVFLIGAHYGLTSLVSFYLPEAKAQVTGVPLVYFRSTPIPKNQFFFWPGYQQRKGENAICFVELGRDNPKPKPIPDFLLQEFADVQDIGVRNIMYHGQLSRPIQLFACRNLK